MTLQGCIADGVDAAACGLYLCLLPYRCDRTERRSCRWSGCAKFLFPGNHANISRDLGLLSRFHEYLKLISATSKSGSKEVPSVFMFLNRLVLKFLCDLRSIRGALLITSDLLAAVLDTGEGRHFSESETLNSA